MRKETSFTGKVQIQRNIYIPEQRDVATELLVLSCRGNAIVIQAVHLKTNACDSLSF